MTGLAAVESGEKCRSLDVGIIRALARQATADFAYRADCQTKLLEHGLQSAGKPEQSVACLPKWA